MTYVIRPAQVEDASDIFRLNCTSLGYDYPLEETQKRVDAILKSGHDRIWVLELPSGVVGYIHAADYDTTYGAMQKNIMALAVDPAVQGEGYGRLLLQTAQDWARLSGASGVRLVSGHDRTSAHAFYAACGYTMRKEQKNFVKSLI